MAEPNHALEEQMKRQIEEMVVEKRRLQAEIDTMKAQNEEYNKNKAFYDKLIAFHKRIDELKDLKDKLMSKNTELMKLNITLKEKIDIIERSANNKDEQEKRLKELLDEVRLIKENLEKQK